MDEILPWLCMGVPFEIKQFEEGLTDFQLFHSISKIEDFSQTNRLLFAFTGAGLRRCHFALSYLNELFLGQTSDEYSQNMEFPRAQLTISL